MQLESKKKSKSIWTNQGGSVRNSGMIHKNDIFSTVEKIEKELGIDAIQNLLGSAGKREFSGDIDIAVSNKTDIDLFLEKLKSSDTFVYVSGKSPISTLVKIETNNTDVYKNVPYTGYVQLDFIFGNPAWLKIYYHSPNEKESNYKGTYRNMLMSAICSNLHKTEKVNENKYKLIYRYKWSPTSGLSRIVRIHEFDDKRKVYKKKHTDYVISKEYIDENDIVSVLGFSSLDSLNSFEKLLNEIQKSYDSNLVNTIIEDFTGSIKTKKMKVPDEII